ncbi:hypothetical protein [Paraburkholderia sp. MM5482-R1]|uniref:hypothetical protein n=1 Tax=unclassified Paraburkholderia TaxID=2615204 RepID=UPI003D1E3980
MRRAQSHFADPTDRADNTDAEPTTEPFNQYTKHARYLSAWNDDCIRIDVHQYGSNDSKQISINLCQIVLDVSGGVGVHRSICLADFPKLVAPLKISLNHLCFQHHEGFLAARITSFMNNYLRLIIAAFRDGRYALSKIDEEFINTLSVNLAKGGWWNTLGYEHALKKLLKLAKKSKTLVHSLKGTATTKDFKFNLRKLQLALRMPIESAQVPTWFVEELAKLAKWNGKVKARSPNPTTSVKMLRVVFEDINLLSGMEGTDCIPYRPFPSPTGRARALRPDEESGRTANLNIADVAKVMTESMHWLYKRAIGIIKLCRVARRELERKFSSDLSDHRLQLSILAAVAKAYPQLKSKYDLPALSFRNITDKSPDSLQVLVQNLFSSCAILISFNHARRREEVVGHDRPYGLHRGCVRPIKEDLDVFIIEIYIEKTLRAYTDMFCNGLVKRCVRVLELLSDMFRPLNTPSNVLHQTTKDYSDKLFAYRFFSRCGFRQGKSPSIFDFGRQSDHFFEGLEIDRKKFDGKLHPFRRFYGLLYTYRHDDPNLIALQNQYWHFSPDQTRIYVEDVLSEMDPDAIREMLKLVECEEHSTNTVLEELSQEYLTDKVERMLSGEPVAGHFSRIILRVAKWLGKSAEFQDASIQEKAAFLGGCLTKMGFRADPKPHCTCMLGKNRHTVRKAKCHDSVDDRVHPERAGADMCCHCINCISTTNHQHTMQTECMRLERDASDFSLPSDLRSASSDAATELRHVIKFALDTGDRTASAFAAFTSSWNQTIGEYQ